jgi:hypothetical protein
MRLKEQLVQVLRMHHAFLFSTVTMLGVIDTEVKYALTLLLGYCFTYVDEWAAKRPKHLNMCF